VSIPVIASGRVEIGVGERSIAAGDFDFLAMGRKLLADPQLPALLAKGRASDIRPCIYCYTCVSTAYVREQVRCAVRPETGFEDRDWSARRVAGTVFVVGGGPAGMEAARRLDAAGNTVVLIERSDRLGGTLRFAGLAYEPNERLLDWLCRQIEASEVEVRLRTEATPELIASFQPAHVVVATGAVRSMPAIPGADQDHVLSGEDLRAMLLGEESAALRRKTSWSTRMATRLGAATGATANLALVRKATHAWMPLGKRIAIIGGALVGLELAEFLVERGRHVSVVDEADKFGAGLQLVRRMRLIAELREHGVAMLAGARDIVIEPEALAFTPVDGTSVRVAADHVIVATGARGDSALADRLRRAGHAVVEIGDGTGIGYIEGAMRGAAEAVAAMG